MPWPPTVNTYFGQRVCGGKALKYLSNRGRSYAKNVFIECKKNKVVSFGGNRLKVIIKAFPPDKRIRDLDNINKALLDSLCKACVYDDDSQIDDLRIIRKDIIKGGKVIVNIEIIN